MHRYLLALSLICSRVTAIHAEASLDDPVLATPAITALLYDHVGVPEVVLDQAAKLVISVYSRAGVTIRWKTCVSLQTDRRMLDTCKHDLNPDELVVRITRPAKSPQWKVRAAALGVAVVLDGVAGHYVSVYYGRIKSLAESRRVNTGLVLGYAVAHEIGHLLLRSTAHSVVGLMRNGWDSESSRQAERGRLFLLGDQAKRAREEAASRAVSASGAPGHERTEN